MTLRFKKVRGFDAPGIYTENRLSNGQTLRMVFMYDECDHIVDVAMVCYKGRYSRDRSWAKEGTAVGPGGLEVFPYALQAVQEAEKELVRRFGSGLIVFVGAANERLFKIYKSRLARHGYEKDDYLNMYLTKEI